MHLSKAEPSVYTGNTVVSRDDTYTVAIVVFLLLRAGA